MADPKRVIEVRTGPPKHWVGDGFHVRSMFSYQDDPARFSPFLLLDYGEPLELAPSKGEPRGVGEHPHRGFETVTVAYQGEIEHRDSAGHEGRIGPGDVQWMTAASGVVHEEKHGLDFTRKGGAIEMAQLWVNLPANLKMSKPRYQDLRAKDIPTVELGAGTARVIAGTLAGATGPARTFTPVTLADLRLKGGAELSLPDGHNALLLAVRGATDVNGTKLAQGQLAVLDAGGETLALENPGDSTVLLMSGEPIAEPVVGYGPFVMNSREEILQAIQDYESGKMGRLP